MATEYKFVRIHLKTTPQQEKAFQELQEAYQKACQFTSDYIFEHELQHTKSFNSVFTDDFSQKFKSALQKKYSFKQNMACTIIRHVCKKYHAVQNRRGLSAITRPIRFKHSQILFPNTNAIYRFLKYNKMVSIQLLGNAKPARCRYDITTRYRYENWQCNRSLLLNKNGNWYLCFLKQHEKEDFSKETVKHVVGIDIGLKYLMYCFDGSEQGRPVISKQVMAKHHANKKRRKELQAIATDEAKKELQVLVDEDQKWKTEVNQRIVGYLEKAYGDQTLYVLEDIDLRHKSDVSDVLKEWKFEQLIQLLKHMASKTNSWVVKVNPVYTSQRCAKCGKICEENRHSSKQIYSCQCGFSCNDDLNAAMNIYELGMRRLNGEKNPGYKKAI